MRHGYLSYAPALPNLPSCGFACTAASPALGCTSGSHFRSRSSATTLWCQYQGAQWIGLTKSKGTMNCSNANGSNLKRSQNPTDQWVQLLPRLLLHLCKTTILMLEAERCCGRSFSMAMLQAVRWKSVCWSAKLEPCCFWALSPEATDEWWHTAGNCINFTTKQTQFSLPGRCPTQSAIMKRK